MLRSTPRPSLTLLLGSTLLFACSSSTAPGNGGGGSGSVVVTAATPASGDGTLSGIAVGQDTLSINAVLHRAVRLTGTVGAVEHSIEVYFAESSGTVYSATHTWGTDISGQPPVVDGVLSCATGGTACVPAQVTVNPTSRVITLTNATFPDALGGGATSTLNGTISY